MVIPEVRRIYNTDMKHSQLSGADHSDIVDIGRATSTVSPLSTNSDTDDSIDVKVRDVTDLRRHDRKRMAADRFEVPKKKFKRAYEEEQQKVLEESCDIKMDDDDWTKSPKTRRDSGCDVHACFERECPACIMTISRTYGLPMAQLLPRSSLPLQFIRTPLSYVPSHFYSDAAYIAQVQRMQLLHKPINVHESFNCDTKINQEPKIRNHPQPKPKNSLNLKSKSQVSNKSKVHLERHNPLSSKSPVKVHPNSDTPLDLTKTTSPEPQQAKTRKPSGNSFSIESILAGKTSSETPIKPRAPKKEKSSISPLPKQHHPPSPCRTKAPPSFTASNRRAVQVPERRELANERERLRVKHLTSAFKELTSQISGVTNECIGNSSGVKFTKVAILRTASMYIEYLSLILKKGTGLEEQRAYDKMRTAIVEVMMAKNNKKSDRDDEEEEVRVVDSDDD